MRKMLKYACILCLLAMLWNSVSAVSSENDPVAQVVSGSGKLIASCTTLQEAFDRAKNTDDLFVVLLRDLDTQATVEGTVYLDLAGFDLKGITIKGTLYGMDSTTNGYNGDNVGVLSPASGTPARHVKTTATQVGAIRRYLRLEEQGGYTFHRYYMGIYSILVNTANDGLGYRACFAGDWAVKTALDRDNGFGMAVGLEPLEEDLQQSAYVGFPAQHFVAQKAFTKSMSVTNILSESAWDNDARGQTTVYARTYIRLADGTVIFSSQVSENLRSALEQLNAGWDSLSKRDRALLDTMLEKYEYQISSWNVANIHHHDQTVWQPWTGTWVSGGHYYLTQDISISRITIEAGQSLEICLNGHDITGSASNSRMLMIKGKLTIHDHRNEQDVFQGDVTSRFTGKTLAPVFYVYEKAEFNLCGGNLKQGEGTTMYRSGVGMIGNGNTDDAAAVMNMYNGTISGGNVQAAWDAEAGTFKKTGNAGANGMGGNLEIVDYGILNMYGGAIYGGTIHAGMENETTPISKQNGGGGNVAVCSTVSVMNMYGGSIYGGTTATGSDITGGRGGNIYNVGTLNILGGTVRDGTTNGGLGGNIYNTGTLNLENVTVAGGVATPLMSDGQPVIATGLGGGIYTTGAEISLCGDVKIVENETSDLYLASLATFVSKGLAQSAQIGITAEASGLLSEALSEKDCFISNKEGFQVKAVNGGVALVEETMDLAGIGKEVHTFSVGYSKNDITPLEEGLALSSFGNPNGRYSSGLNYRPYVTTVAVTDEENNTFLMITMDIQNCPETLLELVTSRISQITGVPAANIYLSATHTHNVPTPSTTTAKNSRYRSLVVDAMVQGAVAAMADRAPAIMQTGSFDTVNMNFSRHYYYLDESGNKVYFGDQFGQSPQNGETVYRVREGDTTMHMLAFEREGKEPVLLVNWRAHPHRSGSRTSTTVDADVIGALREYMQQHTPYLFSYFQGAAGNMNTTSRIKGETYKSGMIKAYGQELGRQLVEGLAELKPVQTGLIQTKKVIYAAAVDHSEDDRYEDAVELVNFYGSYPDLMDTYEEQIAKAAEYSFSSISHAQRIITKHNLQETRDIELNIFSIGDSVAFYTAPGELWDSFSEEMETLSPFTTTFCIGYSNGNVAYIPYQVDYSSYEYHYCLFTQDDTILEMKQIYTQALSDQFEKAG